MLHRDDGYRPQDLTLGDHHWRLINRHPPDFGRLINLWLADAFGSMRQGQVLRVAGVADDRLAGHDVLDAARAPTGLFLHLARRCCGGLFTVIYITARHFPDPAVHDEAVPPHQQDPIAWIIQNRCHRAAPHPEYILRETYMIGKFDICQAHADMRGIVHQALAVDHPLARVSHVRDTTGPDGLARPACVPAVVLRLAPSPRPAKEPQDGIVVDGLHGGDGIQPDAFVRAVQANVIDTEPGSGSDTQAREVIADVGRTGNLGLQRNPEFLGR